jgi:PTH1 family peptidyl-tRNA hydrolase
MDSKLLIVGLGNPGKEYEHTRHNIGFDVLDAFARLHGFVWGRIARGAQRCEKRVLDTEVTLLKPMRFMNLSGEPVASYLRQHPTPADSILIVVDDIHLPVGRVRLRPGGSEGGHNGLKSISAHLRTKDYPRLRIGVGEPGTPDAQIDYVLSRFSRAEQIELQEVMDRAVCAMETWITSGVEAAMNRFNG